MVKQVLTEDYWQMKDVFAADFFDIVVGIVGATGGVYVGEAESGIIAGNWAVVLFWREVESGKEGFRRVEVKYTLVL